jgi:hypothetical protein
MRPHPHPPLAAYNRPSLDTLPSEYVLRRLHGADGAAQRIAAYFHAVTRRNAAVKAARGQVWL